MILTRCPAGAVIVLLHVPDVDVYVPLVLLESIIVPDAVVMALDPAPHTDILVSRYRHVNDHPAAVLVDDVHRSVT